MDITIEEIFDILEETAGLDEDVVLGPEHADTPFKDLGYDSLAVLELSGQLQRRLDVELPADCCSKMTSASATRELIRSLDVAKVA